MIKVVSATRYTEVDFWQKSALGLSLKRFDGDPRLVAHIAYENTLGLPEIYNRAIDVETDAEILLFIHDDIWLDDIFWVERLIEATRQFDIVGVAGNVRRTKNQPAWCFILDEVTGTVKMDELANLSGSISHGINPCGKITSLGASGVACELIDGVLIAATRNNLIKNNLRFDSRFSFHFYDLDFCRVAREKNMTIGTWPISITHQSEGAFNSEAWRQGFQKYIGKWGE